MLRAIPFGPVSNKQTKCNWKDICRQHLLLPWTWTQEFFFQKWFGILICKPSNRLSFLELWRMKAYSGLLSKCPNDTGLSLSWKDYFKDSLENIQSIYVHPRDLRLNRKKGLLVSRFGSVGGWVPWAVNPSLTDCSVGSRNSPHLGHGHFGCSVVHRLLEGLGSASAHSSRRSFQTPIGLYKA